ncbi:Na/Pi symporter [Emcibacter sp.]|uniref:Na/Pi cotransporter family protein n=1 Tax=Emcibacter sp. TaxID=1979954 RepID=UPI002AA8A340|nr:Na/Pi symporter [Emcibacter sp.]
MEILFNAAGGLALFMMAMAMMTDGLKVFAGSALKNILQNWTSSVTRAVLTGALITGFVQSSSAVTVATIGFVNAGILSLRQAIGVIFGSNVGTTITGWLVSIIGFGIKIEALSMPMLALGVLIRYTSGSKRIQGLGQSMIGLALFFLGLSILKASFSGVADTFGSGIFTTRDVGGAWIFVLIGFVITVLTQSSSAAIAIILTAAGEGVVGVNVAAAAIIGANVGTTSTAVLAALNATPNAKRVAAGHVAFNVLTGLLALVMLPLVIWFVAKAGHLIGISDQPVPFLAFFHTAFNILGVLLLSPFVNRLTRVLEKMFRTQEETISRPQFLDQTVSKTPVLAMAAIWKELDRLYDLSCDLALLAIKSRNGTERLVEKQSEAIYSLGKTITDFAIHLRMESMAREQAEDLPSSIRTTRYLEEVARMAPNLCALVISTDSLLEGKTRTQLQAFLSVTERFVTSYARHEDGPQDREVRMAAVAEFKEIYQDTKAEMLWAAAEKHLSIDEVDEFLDQLSRTRRLVEQLAKADHIIDLKKNGMQEPENNSDDADLEEEAGQADMQEDNI